MPLCFAQSLGYEVLHREFDKRFSNDLVLIGMPVAFDDLGLKRRPPCPTPDGENMAFFPSLSQPALHCGCCDHLECESFRGKSFFVKFFAVECITLHPVQAEDFVRALGTSLDAGMGTCLVAEMRGDGTAYSYELLVECKSAVGPLSTDRVARKMATDLSPPEKAPELSCLVEPLPLCGWQVVTYLAFWAGRVKHGDIIGDWDLYPRVVREVENAGFESSEVIREAVLLCCQRSSDCGSNMESDTTQSV